MVRIARIVVLKGDGIGPEVVDQGLRVLHTVGEIRKLHFSLDEELIGGIAIDKTGNPLPDATIKAVKKADAVLLGAVGGPKWNDPSVRPEQGLLRLRQEMGVFANLRPVSLISDSLIPSSPLRADIVKGTDILFVRELTGGVYFGKKQEETDGKAFDTMEYTVEEVTRVTRIAAQLALKRKKKITSVDKANVLATSRMWRKVVEKILKEEFPEITLDHMLVDTAAMKIVSRPTEFDVILTENLFGDILTDEGAVLPGSIGVLPSASLGSSTNGLYEPIHGSAPDIAGKGIANPIGTILSIALLLEHSLNLPWEAQCIRLAVRDTLDQGHRTADMVANPTDKFASTTEITDIILKNLKEKLRVRPMTLCEKILCHHAVGLSTPEVVPDQMLCVQVDWTLASELTWVGMEKTYDQMGRPSVWRNDRFWLAVDHTVDPSNYDQPKPRALIAASEKFAKEANVENYLPANQSILHTDFYRERAQPGMLVVGADSHSCSAGGLGTFAIGLGAADVVVPLVTGETWLRVPPTVKIEYTGVPKFGIGGKDVILHTMGKLKRNTVAFERAVEYTGNLSALSCDARFAISNMTAEFGGIVGVFAADEITSAYVAKRTTAKHKNNPIYFRADADAHYEATYQIPLDEIDTLVALFPSPDNVVPVSEVAGKKLDGVFIGACTTAEEDLILAALVLEQGLKKGFTPAKTGKRKVTPGSVSIVAKLRRLGLIEIYEKAGFEIGAPGCSYCLGVAADKAGEGEVWLSSQNRNFENRMGKGSIANLASAACVASSSFTMTVQDPRPLLDSIDKVKYQEMLEIWIAKGEAFEISEPHPNLVIAEGSSSKEEKALSMQQVVEGKVQRFGDNIDTDAIIPAEFMPGKSDEDLGTHAFQYVRPSFVEKVKEGFNVVVAGVGFGCGSSREEAPRALKGSGILAVIAKSYAFIYGRNQPNMSLLGFTINEEKFYELAQEGVSIKVDVPKRTVTVAGQTFKFGLSLMEERLLAGGGVTEMFNKYKNQLFRVAMGTQAGGCGTESSGCKSDAQLAW